jgi:hypothetical protein
MNRSKFPMLLDTLSANASKILELQLSFIHKSLTHILASFQR